MPGKPSSGKDFDIISMPQKSLMLSNPMIGCTNGEKEAFIRGLINLDSLDNAAVFLHSPLQSLIRGALTMPKRASHEILLLIGHSSKYVALV
jgi:hypothetical protein